MSYDAVVRFVRTMGIVINLLIHKLLILLRCEYVL